MDITAYDVNGTYTYQSIPGQQSGRLWRYEHGKILGHLVDRNGDAVTSTPKMCIGYENEREFWLLKAPARSGLAPVIWCYRQDSPHEYSGYWTFAYFCNLELLSSLIVNGDLSLEKLCQLPPHELEFFGGDLMEFITGNAQGRGKLYLTECPPKYANEPTLRKEIATQIARQ